MCKDIPNESMWFEYQRKITFLMDTKNNKLVCKKSINTRIYTITRELPETVGETDKLLNRMVNLPDEFWRPID